MILEECFFFGLWEIISEDTRLLALEALMRFKLSIILRTCLQFDPLQNNCTAGTPAAAARLGANPAPRSCSCTDVGPSLWHQKGLFGYLLSFQLCREARSTKMLPGWGSDARLVQAGAWATSSSKND